MKHIVKKLAKISVIIVLLSICILSVANICVFADSNNSSSGTYAQYFYDGKWHEYNIPPIHIQINGEILKSDVPPMVINNRSLVPARAVFEKLGAKVTWDGANSRVGISLNDMSIFIGINSKKAFINGQEYSMEVPAKAVNSRTFIPARFVAEALGMNIEWDGDNRIIKLENCKKDVNINSINYTVQDSNLRVIISTDKELDKSQVSALKLETDPRIVIDIKDGILSDSVKSIDIKDGNVRKIRAAQNSINPCITRVVMDLKEISNYNLSLSEDRKQIYVDFNGYLGTVSDIKYDTSSGISILSISAQNIQKPHVFRLSAPDRVVMDIPCSKLSTSKNVADINDSMIKGVRLGQFEHDTVRVVIDVNSQPQFLVGQTNTGIKIGFFEPKYKNLYYDNSNGSKLVINTDKVFPSTPPKGSEYTVKIPYSELDFGTGNLIANDGYLDYVDIVRNDNTQTTDIVLKAKKEYNFILTQDKKSKKTVIEIRNYTLIDNSIDMNIKLDSRAKNKLVVLDPGHGGTEPGAIKDNYKEKTYNLDICLKLYDLLKKAGVNVCMTRNNDATVALYARPEFANDLNAELFLSIHNNAMLDTRYDGTMSLYDPKPVDKKYGISSKEFASIVQQELLSALGTTDRKIRERPDLAVLNRTKMPAVLAEIAFMTNPSDMSKLNNEKFKMKAAQALYRAVIRTLNESVK